MNHYEVSYAARKSGSIGIFGTETRIVAAETPEDARKQVFDMLHQPPYEWETMGSHVEQLSPERVMAMFDQQAINEEYNT